MNTLSSSCHPSACLNQLIIPMYVDLLLSNDDLVSILYTMYDNKHVTTNKSKQTHSRVTICDHSEVKAPRWRARQMSPHQDMVLA